jgi:sulfur carrier protein
MKLKINGKEQDAAGITSLSELIKSKGLSAGRIVVEYNYDIVMKEKWDEIVLCEGDNVEIVSFVCGG